MFKVLNYSVGTYSEATHDQDPHLTLLSKTEEGFKCTFPTARCKDFFNEVFNKIFTGKDFSIYGFKTENIDINDLKDSDRFYILIVPRKQDLEIENIRNFIKMFDTDILIHETDVNAFTSAIVDFPKRWAEKPYMLSLLINFCRIGVLYQGGTWEEFKEFLGNNTTLKHPNVSLACIGQVIKSLPLIDDFLQGKEHDQSYSDYKTTSELHNNSGSVSFCKKIYKT